MNARLKFAPYAAMGLFGLSLIMLSGCGGGVDAGTVPISGTVSLDGQPIAEASVAFIGKGGAKLSTATTDSAGKFNLRAAPGKNAVTVSKATTVMPTNQDPANMLMPTDAEYAKLPTPKAEIPSKYADPKTSGLGFEVTDGMDVEISLSSK